MIKYPICDQYDFKKRGDYDICPVCGWENDAIQLASPAEDGGANDLSLSKYKNRYDGKNK